MKIHLRIITPLILVLLFGCMYQDKDCQTTWTFIDVPPHALKFVPYQKNDTIRFTNSNGKVLTYVCTSRDIITPPADNYCEPDHKIGTMIGNRYLKVPLICLEDASYNLTLQAEAAYNNNLGLISISDNVGWLSFEEDNNSVCGWTSGYYYDTTVCLNSISLGNQIFNNVIKTYRYKIEYPNYDPNLLMLETCYYNQQNGLIKFQLQGDSWTLK